jgi:hypothetical protein
MIHMYMPLVNIHHQCKLSKCLQNQDDLDRAWVHTNTRITGVRIFRASNDVGPLFVGSGCTRILGPTNRGPTSLLALKIRTPVANTGKLRSIGQVPV